MSKKTSGLFFLTEEIKDLNYEHREGGKYALVKILSLTRELPGLTDSEKAADLREIALLREKINEALWGRLTPEHKDLFETVKRLTLKIIKTSVLKVQTRGLITDKG